MKPIDRLTSSAPEITPAGQSLDVIPPGKGYSIRQVIAGLERQAAGNPSPCVRAECRRRLAQLDARLGYRRERWMKRAAVAAIVIIAALACGRIWILMAA